MRDSTAIYLVESTTSTIPQVWFLDVSPLKTLLMLDSAISRLTGRRQSQPADRTRALA
jgi:hypothetical protein